MIEAKSYVALRYFPIFELAEKSCAVVPKGLVGRVKPKFIAPNAHDGASKRHHELKVGLLLLQFCHCLQYCPTISEGQVLVKVALVVT